MNLLHEKRRALGYHASCADAPDTSGMNAAAEANAKISKEALDFYRQVYAEQAPQRDAAAKIAMDVANQQLASSKLNDTISQDYWNYQKDTYRPLEQGIVADAQAYDTPAKREAAASEAVADVGMQAQAARQAQARQQQRMGVNPSSGKTLALNSQMSMSEALGKAGAANMGRTQARNEGIALEDRASNMLAGYPSMGMAATGAGAQFGAAGLGVANSGLSGLTAGANSAGSMAGAMGSNATSMYGAQASYKNQQDQIAASSDPFNTILGAAAGVGMRSILG